MAMTQAKKNKLLLDLPVEPELREQYMKATGLTDDDILGSSTQPNTQKASTVQQMSVQNAQPVQQGAQVSPVQTYQDYASAFPSYSAYGQNAVPSGTTVNYSFSQSQQSGQYASPYGAQIDSMLAQLDNYGTFSYDPEADPDYQAYRQIYTNLGRDAMENAIGTAAAATGGIASSYAASAAAQANNKYMSQLAGAVPELSQNAYTRWANERGDIYNRLSALMQLENSNYDRFVDNRNYEYQLSRDAVNDKRYADELDYARYLDARNYAYQLSRDAISDSRYTDETDYARYLDERNYLYQLERDAIEDNRYDEALEYERMINDRDFAYNAAMNQLNYEYQTKRDDIADARYADELAYSRAGDQRDYELYLKQLAASEAETERQRALDMAQLAAAYGDYSGLNALGINTSNYSQSGASASDMLDFAKTAAQYGDTRYLNELGIDTSNYRTEPEEEYNPTSDDVIDTIIEQAKKYTAQIGSPDIANTLKAMYRQTLISPEQYIAALKKAKSIREAESAYADLID